MTPDQLYHVLGLPGYRTVGEWYEQEQTVLEVESTLPLQCSQCQRRNVIRRGRFPRDFRAPSIGDKGLIIRYGFPACSAGVAGQCIIRSKWCLPPAGAGISNPLNARC